MSLTKEMVCGTTNCDACGGPAPTSSGLCSACHEAMRNHSILDYVKKRVEVWEASMSTLKQREKELTEELLRVHADIQRRQDMINELRNVPGYEK